MSEQRRPGDPDSFSEQMRRRLERDVDPIGTESATFKGSDEDLAKALGFIDAKAAAGQLHIDLDVAVDACKRQMTGKDIAEQVAFVRGFLSDRGWHLDIDDAILVMLTMPEEDAHAVSEVRPGS